MDFVGWILIGIAVLFAGFVLLNLYFRVKVLRSYRKLSRSGVEFAASAIFSQAHMQEVIDRYPAHEAELLQFARFLRYSIWMASVFLVVVIIFGSVLMYYR